MRKRKSPIALVSVLAVMASVAFGFNYAASRGATPADQPPPAPEGSPKPLGDPRTAETATNVSGAIKQGLGATSAEKAPPPGGPPGMPGDGLTILNPAQSMGKAEKPKPNTSSTYAQWYDKDSGMGAKK